MARFGPVTRMELIRRYNRWTQLEVCVLLSMEQVHYSRLESGYIRSPRPDTLQKIRDVFGEDYDSLKRIVKP